MKMEVEIFNGNKIVSINSGSEEIEVQIPEKMKKEIEFVGNPKIVWAIGNWSEPDSDRFWDCPTLNEEEKKKVNWDKHLKSCKNKFCTTRPILVEDWKLDNLEELEEFIEDKMIYEITFSYQTVNAKQHQNKNILKDYFKNSNSFFLEDYIKEELVDFIEENKIAQFSKEDIIKIIKSAENLEEQHNYLPAPIIAKFAIAIELEEKLEKKTYLELIQEDEWNFFS